MMHSKSCLWLSAFVFIVPELSLAAPPEGPGYSWKLVFEDNFDGASLDTTKWGYNYSWGTTHNHAANMQQSQVTVSDSQLVLTAKNVRSIWNPWGTTVDGTYWPYDYTSGAIYSKPWFYRGYFEGSLKMSGGIGTWPAFWMLKSGWPPEIDIMENPCSSSGAINTYHYYYHYNNGTRDTSFGTSYAASGLSTGYHTYGCEWTDTQMAFYYDNSQRGRWTSSYLPNSSMYLILNLAVGGWGGTPDLTSTGWTYDSDNNIYTTAYTCDWVRVWQRNQDTVKECVGYWKLDDQTGTTVTDSSGKNMTGTLNGTSFDTPAVPGRFKKALNFDGTDDYIDLPDGFSEFDNGITFALWAYPTAVKNWARFIDLGQGQGNDNILLAREATSNTLIFQGWGGESGGGYVRASEAIELNKWQFFAVTINTSGTVTLYKNGTAVATGTSTWPWGVTRTSNYIGRSNWSADSYYQGYMDDIRIFDYVLTTPEIQALYNADKPVNPTPATGAGGIATQTSLNWIGGISDETAWNVYLGTSQAAISAATIANAEYQGVRYQPQIATPMLTANTTYYWRVDPVLADGTVITGTVWSFTTGILTSQVTPKFSSCQITKQDAVEGIAYNQSLTTDLTIVGTVTYQKLGGPDWINITEEGTLTGIPPEGSAGQTACTVRATDSFGREDEALITFHVLDTCSGRRGMMDLLRFSENWLYSGPLFNPADLNLSQTVDLADWQHFAAEWKRPIESGLVAAWDMDDASGSTIKDQTGSYPGTLQNMNGTYHPLEVLPVYTNHCLSFDGINDSVIIAGFKGIGGGQSRTCMAWIRSYQVGGQILTWGTNITGQKWVIRINDNGTLRAEVANGYIYGKTFLADGFWHHIAVVLDNDGTPDISEAKLYVDGHPEQSGFVSACAVNTSSDTDVQIGVFAASPLYFKGQIDNVRIYNRTFNAAEILDACGPYPAAYWPLDTITSSVTSDKISGKSGRVKNMSIASLQSGHDLNALLFDGIDDYIMTDYTGITGTQARTCSAWIKAGTISTTNSSVIISWGSEATGGKWIFRLQTTGKLSVGIWGGYVEGSTVLNDNQWHHVAAVLADDGSPSVDEIKLYVDGVQQTTYANNTQAINTENSQPVQIGSASISGSQSYFFKGLIDDVAIFDRALSATEISDLVK